MHILIVIDGLPGGGAERTVITLAKGLVSHNHKVTIFSLREICDYNLPKGIKYKIIVDHAKHPWRKCTEIYRRVKSLDKEIDLLQKNKKFDLIISNLYKTDSIIARSRILPKDKVWFCLHTMFSFSYLKELKIFYRWIKYFKIRNLYHNRNIIAVSKQVLKDLKQVFNVKPSKEIVICNPFDFKMIKKLSQMPCDLNGKNYLIHVARLHKHKCQTRLIRAYAKSGIQDPLIIIGKSNNFILNELKSLISFLKINNRVFFKKFDSNPYPYIYHARMLILSSDIEGFGNVLVEGLICQTPVVSTCCPGGPIEILNNTLSTGLSNMNSTSLAHAMQRVYYNPPKIEFSFIKSYEINNVCRKYINLV